MVLDKIRRIISSWVVKHLSFAGRAQLVSSVIFGIRAYWMSIFPLPSSVVDEIDKLCRQFLWGDKDGKRKLRYMAWEKIYTPKNLGGLGFRNGALWNKATIGRFILAIELKQDSLWLK